MNAAASKQIRITDFQAKRLKQLAKLRGTTESALVEESLELLFREQDRITISDEALHATADALDNLQLELGSDSSSTLDPISLDGAVLIVGTPTDDMHIRHLESRR